MVDESTYFKPFFSSEDRPIKLGYLVENQDAQPFTLALEDMTSLFVLGDRAVDIYYSLLLQLCDEHHVPVLVLTGRDSEGYEEQICETRFWQLDTARDHISLNLFDIGETVHATDHVAVLVDILNDLHPLSNAAQNLLHIVIWQTLLTTPKACFQGLQSVLARYRQDGSYKELCRLFASLPDSVTGSAYDNVSLGRLSRTSTIVTARAVDHGQFTINMLLLKLLAGSGDRLPAIFLVNPPPLNKHLFHWLCGSYAAAESPLVLFDSYDSMSSKEADQARSLVLTAARDASRSTLCNGLTREELSYLQACRDQVAVKLRDEHATRFVTIF
jgi:hypothetical protein